MGTGDFPPSDHVRAIQDNSTIERSLWARPTGGLEAQHSKGRLLETNSLRSAHHKFLAEWGFSIKIIIILVFFSVEWKGHPGPS